MAPRVSVVAAFYNQAPFAAQTVESVLAQEGVELELILADDGSRDGTIDILRSFAKADPERVRLVAAERNRGIAANINAGLAAASGELVAWLGGDDVMLPGKLRRQAEVMAHHPAAVACVHDAEVFVSATGQVLGRFTQLYNGRAGVRSGGIELQFDPTYFMLPSATMFRRRAAPEHGFDERLRFANDWLWTTELLRGGDVVGIPDVLVRYRRHDSNITADPGTRARTLEEGLIALAVLDARYPDLHRLVRRRAAAFHLAAARQLAAEHRWRTAASHVQVAVAVAGAVGSVHMGTRLVRTRIRRHGDPPS